MKLNFSELLMSSAAVAIESVLGKSGSEAVLRRINKVSPLDDLTGFDRMLLRIIGEGGVFLEREIVKELYRRLGIPHNNGSREFDFVGEVEFARGAAALMGW